MLTGDQHTSAERMAMYTRNRFKIGFFGSNCSSGIAATKVPERWSGTWDDNVRLAQMLDAAGIEFMLPVGRWKGWGGETNFEGSNLDTVTWAAGLLGATKNITVFGTVHAPLVHPVFAAKQFVTADHISHGRFGLNIVCGWNQDEFDMFGAQQRDHDERYAYGSEWMDVIRKLWMPDGKPFDFDGHYLQLRGLEAEPTPFGGSRPVVMNAGASAAGKAFALTHADYLFTPLRTLEQGAESVRGLKADAHARGRDIDLFTNVHIICRPTKREADEYYHYFADAQADWGAVEHMQQIGGRHGSTSQSDGSYQRMRVRFAAGYGGYPLVGTPDDVAAEITRISAAGFVGFAAGLVNFIDEFPYLQAELLPRLQRLGLRDA
jgi:FMNH2-dependent dimethyl sulfone monooxygenase